MEDKEDPASVPTNDTQDGIGPNTTEGQNAVVPESDGDGNTITDDESKESDSQSKDFTSPNTSSDLFCGTPQKTNSRRQSFITLEKYSGGKSPCPGTAPTFPGPLAKATDGQERANSSGATSSPAAQRSTGSDSQVSSASSPRETKSNQSLRSDAAESPVRPRECGTTCEPRRLIESLPSRATEAADGEPGVQIEAGKKEDEEVASTLEEESLSQEEKLDESQSSVTKTSGEPRRSGRHRVRPSRPSEEPEEKPVPPKRTRSQEAAQSKPNTRKRPTSEEDNGRERLRTRAQAAASESSQSRTSKRVKLYSSSQDFLENVEPKRSSSRDSSQTDLPSEVQADGRSQSQGRSGRKSKTSPPTEEESETSTKVLQDAKEATKTEPLQRAEDLQEEDGPKGASQASTPSPEQRDDAQELRVGEKSEMDEDAKEDSQNTTTKQELVPGGTVEAKMVPVTPTDSPKTMESSEEILSQEDSKENVLSSQDGQSLRRSRRSKVSSDPEESDEKRKHHKSARPSRACSQGSSPANSQTKTSADGRTRRSGQTKSSPLSTPDNSQSAEPSNETGRYSSRRSSQASQSKANSSLLESSEPRANIPAAKRKGRKPRVSTQNPASLESDPSVQDTDPSSLNDSQSTQDFQTRQSNLDDSQSTQEDPVPESSLQGPQPVHTNPDTESNSDGFESTEGKPVLESHLDHLQPKQDTTMADDGEPQTEMDCESPSVSPPMDQHSVNDSTSGIALSKDNDDTDLQTAGSHGTEGGSCEASISSDEPTVSPAVETTLGTEKSVEETKESPSQCDAAHQEPVRHPEDQELEAIGPTDVHPCTGNQTDGSSDPNSVAKQEEQLACVTEHASSSRDADATDVAPQVKQDVGTETTECRDEDETKTDDAGKACDTASVEVCSASAMTSQRGGEEVFLDSPLKQKDLDGVIGQDLGQSPSSRTRGTWSPSASPSTSILKKGQKRPLEDQTPSPLVKVNRGLVLVLQHIPAFVGSHLILFFCLAFDSLVQASVLR